MIEKPELLSVVTKTDGDVIYIHADLSGLKRLRGSIDSMITELESGVCDHDHLHTEDWAGYELTNTMLESERINGCTQVHHVKLYAWT
ncbi:Imm32 family immunity protein [Agarivorans sp. DSG3-1]|uniref:Imm32 family immunity protein n=1 Tax=Agarivorans sp. DSG3-1 TaxID=3342249 RepID=UPI00398EFF0D